MSRHSVLSVLAVLLALAAGGVSAQEPISGRVVLGGEPVAGVEVTLHHVTRGGAGPAGTTTSGADGRFRIARPAPDSGSFNVVFATAEFRGVRYFGPPIHGDSAIAGYTVEVFDTTSVSGASPVRIKRRDVILLPEEQGGWEVNEIVQIENPGTLTLLSRGRTTAELRIPAAAGEFEVGQGELTPDDVVRKDDRVLVVGPLTPGTRDLLIRYRIPADAGSIAYPAATPTESFQVIVREPAPELQVARAMGPTGVEVEGELFLRYVATDPSQDLEIRWDGAGGPPMDPIHAAAGLTGLILLGGAGAAARRRSHGSDEPAG